MKKQNQKRKTKVVEDVKASYFVNFRVCYDLPLDVGVDAIQGNSQMITDHVLAALEVAGTEIDNLTLQHRTGMESENIRIPIVSSEMRKNG